MENYENGTSDFLTASGDIFGHHQHMPNGVVKYRTLTDLNLKDMGLLI